MTPGYAPGTAGQAREAAPAPAYLPALHSREPHVKQVRWGKTSRMLGGALPSFRSISMLWLQVEPGQGEELQIVPQQGSGPARARRDQRWERRLRRVQWRREWGPAAGDSGLRSLFVFMRPVYRIPN